MHRKILCYFGIHNYKLKRKIFNDKYECGQSIYICKYCNKEKIYNFDKESDKYNLKGINNGK